MLWLVRLEDRVHRVHRDERRITTDNAPKEPPSTCSASDPGRGQIDGTRFPDRICGRRGVDVIDPLDGKDFVFAGAGPDRIFARDIYRDVIDCGRGKDVVFADRKDVVARDCEQVRRLSRSR